MTPSRVGLLVSLLLHAGVALLVLWWWYVPTPSPAKGVVVPLNLAMFQTPPPKVPESTPAPAEPLQPVSRPEHPPQARSPESGKPAPGTHEPEKQEVAKPTPEPVPVPEKPPEPVKTAPKPIAKPKPEPASKPVPPKPVETRPKAKAEPMPERTPAPKTKPVLSPAQSPTPKSQAAPRQPAESAQKPAAPAASPAPNRQALVDMQLQYQAALSDAINRAKFYPRLARRLRQEGVVTVAFTVLADGRLVDVHVTGSSGLPLLDKGAVEAIERVGQFRPIPPALGLSRMPVQISLNYNLR